MGAKVSDIKVYCVGVERAICSLHFIALSLLVRSVLQNSVVVLGKKPKLYM